MICLLWLLLSPLMADFPPFSANQLPYRRQYEITENTGGESVTIPIHFGPTGTEAWESIFVAFLDFNTIEFIFTDCFCNGDSFVLNVAALDTGFTSANRIIPRVDSAPCSYYEEDPGICAANDPWASQFFFFASGVGRYLNISFSTLGSPFGGGVAYFAYNTYMASGG